MAKTEEQKQNEAAELAAEQEALKLKQIEEASTVAELEALEFTEEQKESEDIRSAYEARKNELEEEVRIAAEAEIQEQKDKQDQENKDAEAAKKAQEDSQKSSGKTVKLVPLYNLGVGRNGVNLKSGVVCDVTVEDLKMIGENYFRKPEKKDEPKKGKTKKGKK